ncbi:DUF1353 domain-containing protein [Fusobacterium animalis]|uniref:DUF1353 domain-containing protein n=1 Tax=Fusobacterium animalis TaxID=76859 RepID=UPI001C6E70F8|nr:DUF1353 domain-containing protein [Fusobacterium animalis]QYR65715.1 DUF1353 domain-containing protein [Fusobacterium animalis]
MELSPLLTEPLADNKWILKEEYKYEINGFVITVPKGFITDLASVPRILWIFFPPFGKYTRAAIIHDYLYSELNDTFINRYWADKIFIFIMKEHGVSAYKRVSMYRAVRMFGEPSWKRKIKNEGYTEQAVIDHTKEAIKYNKEMKEKLKL